jgi:hypothetical protein
VGGGRGEEEGRREVKEDGRRVVLTQRRGGAERMF